MSDEKMNEDLDSQTKNLFPQEEKNPDPLDEFLKKSSDEDEHSSQKISTNSVKVEPGKNSWVKWVLVSLMLVILIVFFSKYVFKNLLAEGFRKEEEVFIKDKKTKSDNEKQPIFDTFDRSYHNEEEKSAGAEKNISTEEEEVNFSLMKARSPMRVQSGSDSNTGHVTTNANNLDETLENDQNPYESPHGMLAAMPSKKNKISKDRYDNDSYASVKAKKIDFDPDLTLEKGTFIPCSLRTKIISTIAGEVSCVIPNDIYSVSGNVLLIEKGSKVFGTYESGQLKIGEERLFVIWEEIRTPNNISININSNATGTLGESGIGGEVDEHFAKRFGTALLVSLISELSSFSSAVLTDRIFDRKNKNNNSQLSKNQSGEGVNRAKDVANSILEKQMNIEPTLYKNQGEMVGIFVARDVDFSNVYSLRRKASHEGKR